MIDKPSASIKRAISAYFGVILLLVLCEEASAAMTHKQLIQSMDMMRSACAPKFPKLTADDFDGLRAGNVANDNKDLKCYTTCIAQMSGTITKKKELNFDKVLAQFDTMLPDDLKEPAVAAVNACKNVQGEYKDVCDRTWYTVVCMRNFNPAQFSYP